VAVRVAFPVLFSTIRLHLDKGRQWSVVEHLLLHALARSPSTATELAKKGDLPRRLVLEAIIRLMRSGWVEMLTADSKTGFRATRMGIAVAERDVLPAPTRPVSRKASFAIDRISGWVFRAGDLNLYTPQRFSKLRETGDVMILPATESMPARRPDEIISRLLDDDEQYRGSDASAARPVEWHALVTVYGETIEGLPSTAPKRLRDQIVAAAKKKQVTARDASGTSPIEGSSTLDIVFDRRDIVLGGDGHRALIEKTLGQAKSWVVIHSTFVSAARFKALLPAMSGAISRGARIDVLWGQAPGVDGSSKTADEILRCDELLESDILRERIKLHRFSTGSHAKLLFADDGKGKMIGVVGSCNWLFSDFSSYEISAKFADPLMVGEIAGQLSTLSMGSSGHWSTLTRDLAGQAANLRRQAQPSGSRLKATLVLGAGHGRYMRMARDQAKKRIVVASHRLSEAAETTVLIPARAAAGTGSVDVTLYFGTASGQLDGIDASELVRNAKSEGVRVRRIFNPRLHAKFLVWDDENAVITSQNWLSADPADSNPLAEIGVYLRGSGVGRDIIDRTRVALPEA
jgi:cardiolipin synthase